MVARLRSLADSLSGFLWLLALLALLFYVYVYVYYAGALLDFPFDFDQGEGYDVYSGILLAQGQWIYNDSSAYPFYSSNYPPLYSMLVALAVQIFGPSLFAGRLVSVVASFLLGLLIYAIVRRGSQSGWIGAIAAAAFFGSTYVYHVAPLARVNASMSLFALMGVFCVGKRSWRWLALGTFFLLAAVYTKQTAVDAVAAALMYLVVCCWKRALVVGAALAILGGVVFYVLDQNSGGQFYVNAIEANLNPYEWRQTEEYYGNFLGIHAVLLGLAFLGLLVALWKRSWSVYHVYLLTALGGAAAVGKWGAGESYFLNSVVATCVVAGLSLGELRRLAPFWLRPALPLLFLVQMPLFWHGPFDGSGLGLVDRGTQSPLLGRPPTSLDVANGWRIMTYVARSKGDMLLEESAFALVDHRAIVGNASQLLNLSLIGRWDERDLVRALDQKRFSLVILKAQFYPSSVLEAIGRNYGTATVLEMVGRPYRVMTRKPTNMPLPGVDLTGVVASGPAAGQLGPDLAPEDQNGVLIESGPDASPQDAAPVTPTTTAMPAEAVPTPEAVPALEPTSVPTVVLAGGLADEGVPIEGQLPASAPESATEAGD